MANPEDKLALQEKVKEKVALLKKQGGFRILEGVIDGKKGIRELNPKDEARRAAFLTDEDKAEKRKSLKAELEILKELIEMGSLEEGVEKSREQSSKAANLLNENLHSALKETKDLEVSYRSMDLFFRNSGEESIRNLFFINMPLEEFTSAENTVLREGLVEHFDYNYDRFSLQDNYSLMVVPGYLENNLEYFSKLAAKYRITLVTDYSDERDFESIQDNVEEKKISGSDRHLANTIVACNYGVVRQKYPGIENEDLVIPLSIGLAGKMYSGNGIQPAAGKKYGKIDGVLGTRIDLLRSQADEIDKMGMVPVIYEKTWGTVAMSDTTLCSESSDPDNRAIGVVRAKDWIAKVLLDYFNSLTFQTFDGDLRREIKGQLHSFFKKISGYGGLVEKYEIEGPEADPENPQIVKLAVNVKPYFATKHYVIDFSGTQNRFKAEENE